MEITEIKQKLPILKLLAYYGITADKNNHIKCPFHDDDTQSCKIYPETNTYHCFGCGKTGDVIQFIQDKEQCTKHEAILKAKMLIGKENINPVEPVNTVTPKTMSEQKPFNELFSLFQKTMERSDKAKRYCTNRELDYKTLQIGYNSGTYYKKIRECIVFPLKGKNGNITSLYGRRIIDSLPGRKNSHSFFLKKAWFMCERAKTTGNAACR